MPIGLLSQSFPPKSKFTESEIPSQAGRVAIVTGAAVGIGFEAARALLAAGAKVYIAGRSEEKAVAAIKQLKELTGQQAEFLLLDLGNIQASRNAALDIMAKEPEIHLLMNSAGVMTPPRGAITSDGYDLQWGTNCLGHYIFTETLLPTLISTAANKPPGTVRIITTSSSAHTMAVKGGVNMVDLTQGPNSKAFELYGQSKLGNIIMSNFWAKKLEPNGIICISLNPGNIQSSLQRHMNPIVKFGIGLILHETKMGAITQLYAGTSNEVTMKESGAYFVPWARVDVPARSEVADEKFCGQVIELMEKQCQDKLTPAAPVATVA